MKKYLCIGEEYDSNGEKKMSWKRIGELFQGKSGKTYVKIYHMPGTLIHVFEEQKKPAQDNDDEDLKF